MEIFRNAGEKVQVVGNVLVFIEGVFSKKNGKLGLDAKAWAKGLLQEMIISARSLSMEIKEQHIKSETVFHRKL